MMRRISLFEELEELLDRERTILMAGQVDQLGRLAEQKTALMAKVQTGSDPDSLESLRRKALRNASLLEAASRGVKSVKDRIAQLRRGPESLFVYSPSGDRSIVGSDAGSVKTRA